MSNNSCLLCKYCYWFMNDYCNYRYEYSGDGVTCDGFILIPFPEKSG